MKLEISQLSIEQLKELKSRVESQIVENKRLAKVKKKHTKEEIIYMFSDFGYEVPKGAKIWKIADDNHAGAYGMEVGGYTHSCHIDTTDFKVLLVVDGGYHGVESYADMWLEDCIVI